MHLAQKVIDETRKAERRALAVAGGTRAHRYARVECRPVLTRDQDQPRRRHLRRAAARCCAARRSSRSWPAAPPPGLRALHRPRDARGLDHGGGRRRAADAAAAAGSRPLADRPAAPAPRAHRGRRAGRARGGAGPRDRGRADRPPRRHRARAGIRAREPEIPREPRHVRAVPTNAELKMERAIDVFNRSQHPRTVAGVAQSLGTPEVTVRTSEQEPSVVTLFVMWELSWYRYEVDLSDEAGGAPRGPERSSTSSSRRTARSTRPPTSAATSRWPDDGFSRGAAASMDPRR